MIFRTYRLFLGLMTALLELQMRMVVDVRLLCRCLDNRDFGTSLVRHISRNSLLFA